MGTSVVYPSTKITSSLLNGNNYKDWAYSAKMTIKEAKRLGYIDGTIKKLKEDYSRSSDWVSENMLIMNWILNSMVKRIAANFKYSNIAKDLRDSIEAAYATH